MQTIWKPFNKRYRNSDLQISIPLFLASDSITTRCHNRAGWGGGEALLAYTPTAHAKNVMRL